MLSTLDYEWGHRYPRETHTTRSWPCYGYVFGEHIIIIHYRDMCSGERISWGNTYHCNTSTQSGAACTRPMHTHVYIMHTSVTCIDMHAHARTYTHTVTCTHACTHTCTHTHTHTHANTRACARTHAHT